MTPAELRRAASAGIAFVVLFVVGVFVTFGNSPDIKKHDSDAVTAGKFVAKLSDSGARTGLLVGAYLLVAAALAFVWFSQALSQLVAAPAAARLIVKRKRILPALLSRTPPMLWNPTAPDYPPRFRGRAQTQRLLLDSA